MRSRDKRAQRHQVHAMKRDFPDFEEEGEDLSEDESFTLPSGEAVNPRQPWLVPQQPKDKSC